MYSILLSQLIATLIHYPCVVALPGLADWSAFLELVFADYVKSQLSIFNYCYYYFSIVRDTIYLQCFVCHCISVNFSDTYVCIC